jgi:hypothetical protein
MAFRRQNDGGLLFMRRLLIAVCCALTCWSVRAEPVMLDDAMLRGTLSGKTVYLDTPLGIGIPITYHGNGLMSGEAGLLEYILGAPKDRGRWWVADGKLCQKWFKWLDAQPSCMRLRQDRNRIFWQRDDGMSGTATIAAALPPGADAAPRGLGGPVEAAELPRPPISEDPPQVGKPAGVAMPSHGMPAAGRAAAQTSRAPAQALGKVIPIEPNFAARPRVSMLAEQFIRATHGDRWCQRQGAAEAEDDPAPELIKVARAPYAASALLPPTYACLATEPPLQYTARFGLDAR